MDKYKKAKRFLALFVVGILLLLIAATFIVALLGNKVNENIFNGLLSCIFFIPVIIYVFLIFYRYFNKPTDEHNDDNK